MALVQMVAVRDFSRGGKIIPEGQAFEAVPSEVEFLSLSNLAAPTGAPHEDVNPIVAVTHAARWITKMAEAEKNFLAWRGFVQ